MYLMVVRARLVASAMCAASFAACGAQATGNGSPSTNARSPVRTATPAPGPVISGTLSITGQFVVSGAFSSHATVELDGVQTPAPSSTTCASFAKGYAQLLHPGGTGFDAPPAQTNGPTAVYVSVSLTTGYLGPGTYKSATNPLLSGTATVAVTTSQGPSYYVFHSHGSGTTLHVGPDGSGSVQLTGWVDDETRGGNKTGLMTGVVTWTCH